MSPLTVENVTLSYYRHPAVHHLNCVFEAGTMTALIGPNGAGKSTLLKGIIGELQPRTGEIKCPCCRRRAMAYLPQRSDVDRSFPIRVRDLVAMGLWRRRGAFGRFRAPDRRDVASALDAVGLDGFGHRPISALSGGQFQRMLFARLMLQDASIILLDEPFNAVDRKTVDDLMAVIRRWHEEGRTIIAAMHDYAEVRAHFPDTLLIARELIAHGDTADVLSRDNLHRARAVSEAFDETAAICQRAA